MVARLLVGISLLLVSAGCREVLPRDTVVLRIANWGGAGDDSDYHRLVRELYAEFEAENPGIEIQVEGIPGSQEYVSKILLSHVARSAPDVITLDASSSAAFIENGVLLDLSQFVDRDGEFNLSDFYPNVVDIARRGSKLYAIPGDFTPMVVYYNKALFDEAGVPYPKPGWTRNDFLQTARRLTVNGRYGFVLTSWMPGWIMWLWNAGGDVVEADGPKVDVVLDSEQNIQTIRWLADLVLKHKVAPSLSATAAQGVDPFANGQAAMQVSGHWSMVSLAASDKIDIRRLGVAPMPSELEESKTVMYEAGFAIGKYCKNPDAAWKFIKFMTSRRVQARYNATGIAVCARKDVSAERAKDPLERAFVEIVPTARGPWGAKVEGYDLIEDIGQKMMDSILKNGIDPEVAVRAAAEDMRRELAKR